MGQLLNHKTNTRYAMTTLLQDGNQFIKSELPADNTRGRNGDPTPSSVYVAPPPIKDVSPPQVTVPENGWQTRQANASPIAAHAGMTPPKSVETIPMKNNHALKAVMRRRAF
jgi:hypothetical protein